MSVNVCNQAAIAAVLFRFRSNYASLPRLFRGCFSDLSDAPAMMKEFPSWGYERDHHARFKSVGICATVSLLAPDSEAPPKEHFLCGYSVGCLSTDIINSESSKTPISLANPPQSKTCVNPPHRQTHSRILHIVKPSPESSTLSGTRR